MPASCRGTVSSGFWAFGSGSSTSTQSSVLPPSRRRCHSQASHGRGDALHEWRPILARPEVLEKEPGPPSHWGVPPRRWPRERTRELLGLGTAIVLLRVDLLRQLV